MSAKSSPSPRCRVFRSTDLPAALALWKGTPGVGFSPGETTEVLESYLKRNRGLSTIAMCGREMVGAVLCGHDGRRGFLYHLAVAEAWRGRGIGRALVDRSLAKLAALGIEKCNIVVYAHNEAGQAFWRRLGWAGREDLHLMQVGL